MRAFLHTNVLVCPFGADQAAYWPAGRKTLTARRKRAALKRRPSRVVILCAARDTIHRDAPSLLYSQHTC